MSPGARRGAVLVALLAACAPDEVPAAEAVELAGEVATNMSSVVEPGGDLAVAEPVTEPVPASPPESTSVSLPEGPLEIRVTGDDYRWLLRYAGADGRLDTDDDVLRERHVHLPARREVVFDLVSNDYAYTFYVPQLDILEVAVPDVAWEFELDTGRPAVHDLLGSQMCGYTHPELLGDVVVEDEAAFLAWLAADTAKR